MQHVCKYKDVRSAVVRPDWLEEMWYVYTRGETATSGWRVCGNVLRGL